jgi:site-specific DNA-methyltransferase (adenine-specific)
MQWTDKIQVYNEDCMQTMARYEDNHFDLAIVDPPYGIGINVNMGRRKGDKKSKYHKFAGEDKGIPDASYFKELLRVSKNQIIWGGNYFTDYLQPSSCWLLWDKGFSEDVTFAQFEMAWTSFSSSAKKFDKHPNGQKRIHPTQKPVALYNWILDRYAKPDFKIIDTHLGSGSNAIACHHYGCELVAAELDTDYYNDSFKRFKLNTAQQKLF